MNGQGLVLQAGIGPIFRSPENTVCASRPVLSANTSLNSPGSTLVVDTTRFMFGRTKEPKPGKPDIVLMLNPPITPATKSSAGYIICTRNPFVKIEQRKKLSEGVPG